MSKGNDVALAILLACGLFAVALVGGEVMPPSPQCDDGIDNDGDGFSDAQDPECYFTPGVQPGDTEPPTSIFCPTWDDETHPPMNQQECDGV